MKKFVTVFFIFQFLLCLGSQNAYSQHTSEKNNISKEEKSVIGNLKHRIESHYKAGQLDSAIHLSNEIIAIGSTNKDTISITDGYFSMAYYQKKSYRFEESLDSYLKGIRLAILSKDSLKASKMLLNLTSLQNEMGDYNGGQISATRALNLIDKNKNPKIVANLYQGLGNSFQEMMDYKNAISCYNKALAYAESPNSKAGLLNNIANCYRKSNDIQKALSTYKIALADSLKIQPATFARLLDNYGYALFKNNQESGLSFLERGLKMREKDKNKLGIITSCLNLSKWHLDKNKTIALHYATKALTLSKEIKTVDVEVEALELIVVLNNNPKQEVLRLLQLQDSISVANLQNFHQAIGIRFRTEETEKENLTLKQQNVEQEFLTEKEQTQKWVMGGGLAASLAGLGIFFVAYRKNKKQKREIEKQKNRVEELQRELHHRLKNNLSFIDFFITLAKGKFPDAAYREKLDELQNRINSMFEVHKQLFKKEDVTHVNAKTYISALVESVKKAYDAPNITLQENVEGTSLRADTSFPIGLIVNEFVTNSYKYAFPNNEKGTISISLNEDLENYHLKLADNGKGLPENFDIDKLDSFGMETIKLLTQEYKGTFKLDGSNGLKMDITFPKSAA